MKAVSRFGRARHWAKCFAGLLLASLGCANAAVPHLTLEVSLDPGTRAFRAKADLAAPPAAFKLALDPLFKISRDSSNAAGRHVEYSGTLPALPDGNQRNAPDPSPLYASPEGSYLSPGAAWYPDPGVPFTYSVKLSLPAGQKALAPGHQRQASDTAAGYVAQYEFKQPAEGIWVMAGPYAVAQQIVRLPEGKRVAVRTWFHPELSSLAGAYLHDSATYLLRYSRLIGSYPFEDFSIVSSPLPHGLGIPTLTYLGKEVLRLPFIRATSLGHEVLHNWWGNGVYPEWSSGNWSEGLTTFMADYAFREDQSAAAARDMRLNWLRDLTAIAPADETSLAAFTSRHHGISSVVGYSKAAMVFFMLRDEIGPAPFESGLRLFWQRYRFKTASWNDLEATFSRAAGRDLSRFFAQWVQRANSPQLVLASPGAGEARGGFGLQQRGELFDLLVPLRVHTAPGEKRDIAVRVRERDTRLDPASGAIPADTVAVELDPDFRLWRRLDPRAVPPIFREVFISPRAEVFVANRSSDWTGPANALAERLLDARPRQVSEPDLLSSPEVPALVVGDAGRVARLLTTLGIAWPDALLRENPGKAAEPRAKGAAQAWTARSPGGKTFAFVIAESPEALVSVQRSLPHYGRQSWIVFDGGRVVEQGAWPVLAQTLMLDAGSRR
jgi:aminopeptidase N